MWGKDRRQRRDDAAWNDHHDRIRREKEQAKDPEEDYDDDHD